MRLFLISLAALYLTSMAFGQTPRHRVILQDGTLVTDIGTLLRGAYISTDITSTIPSNEDIASIKDRGLNCIHLYGECPEYQTPGERVNLIDSIVNSTAADSLYLVLTIGGCNRNGEYDSAFVRDFWDFYAPRYAEKTHVIYEIVNEPFSWSAPYDSITLEMEKWAYETIRTHAPETHILLMSYASAVNDTSMIADVKKLGATIDWSNASIATHGYSTSSEEFRNLINTVKDSGYAITVTEPESIENEYINLATTRVFEEEFVSYAHFISVQALMDVPAVYTSKIESSELRWQPDFGSWPLSITSINYIDPFQPFVAGFYDEGFGFRLQFAETALGYISNNDYVAYFNLDFMNGAVSFNAECSSGANGGRIDLHLDSLEGSLIGSCNVSATGNWDTYQWFSCSIDPIEGVHRIYFVFKGNNYDLMNLRSFVFNTPVATETHSISNTARQGIQVFPNPANRLINLHINTGSLLEIFTIQGLLILEKKLVSTNNLVSIDHLPAGNYVVRIRNEMQVYTTTLVVE
jgi:hypothetical protein